MHHVKESEVSGLWPVADEGDGQVLVPQHGVIPRQSDWVSVFPSLLGYLLDHLPNKLISVQMYHDCTQVVSNECTKIGFVSPVRAEEFSLELGHCLPYLLGSVGQGIYHLGSLVDGFIGLWTLLQ